MLFADDEGVNPKIMNEKFKEWTATFEGKRLKINRSKIETIVYDFEGIEELMGFIIKINYTVVWKVDQFK